MAELFGKFGFLLYFVAAFFLHQSRRVNLMVVSGLVILGLPGLMFLLYRMEIVSLGMTDDWVPLAWMVGLGLIVVGAFRLAKRSSAPAVAEAQSLETALRSLVIPRNDTNSFFRAETSRDEIYGRFEEACAEDGIQIVGYKSPAQNPTVWLQIDYVLPQDDANLSLRATVLITIQRYDFHRFEHLLTIEITQGIKKRIYLGVIQLLKEEIHAINRYMTGQEVLRLRPERVRQYGFDLWRPKNKVSRLRSDWESIGAVTGIVVLAMIPVVGILLAAAGGVAFWFYSRKRRTYILTTGKPLLDPRYLIRMDSWQTNITGLGNRFEDVRGAIINRIGTAAPDGIAVTIERIWYPGVDGKVERDQIVVRFRRAIGFVHVEPYGEDLYVGWDAHVNGGTWAEETLSRGVDKESGKLVVANRVVAGYQNSNEYDLTDVNFLTEWLHNTLTRVVRLKMEEHRIDQEIDFTIHRESRQFALEASKERGSAQKQESPGRTLLSRLRRVR